MHALWLLTFVEHDAVMSPLHSRSYFHCEYCCCCEDDEVAAQSLHLHHPLLLHLRLLLILCQ